MAETNGALPMESGEIRVAGRFAGFDKDRYRDKNQQPVEVEAALLTFEGRPGAYLVRRPYDDADLDAFHQQVGSLPVGQVVQLSVRMAYGNFEYVPGDGHATLVRG